MKVFLERLSCIESRLLRVIAIGIINTIFGYSIFLISYLILKDHNISISLATVVGVIFNYMTVGNYIFDNQGWKQFPLFIISYIISFLANILILNALVYFELNVIIAQALSLPPTIAISYLFNSRISFRKNIDRPTDVV
ncbi:GtrA family protein [Bosea sp. LjRoot237]|uniref:GtrA family protein n=1 Tax=Bosea sp. LjRoot237 TaxID=3342292 RepID=UPI003F504540